ncbi:hypothetical protein SBOR_3480 [Sclerotinia borealis F-4128]|uniref:Uncharacterized protein n=1 Tax=Sclerotinia borealis (strain F-4128) TaxID=1432307 RepID=W9CN94_SCLBF|nr:hypothetical protein SBOR_3480 [Sclerotinia borealis F-4128]
MIQQDRATDKNRSSLPWLELALLAQLQLDRDYLVVWKWKKWIGLDQMPDGDKGLEEAWEERKDSLYVVGSVLILMLYFDLNVICMNGWMNGLDAQQIYITSRGVEDVVYGIVLNTLD